MTGRHATAVAAVLLAVLFTTPPAWCGWAGDMDGLRDAMAEVRSIRAPFVQEKHLPILENPIESTGEFHWRAPGNVRWEYEKPVRTVLLMSGEDLLRYTWRDGGWSRDSGGGLEAVRAVVEDINSWMSGDFDRSETFSARLEPGDPARVVLTPRAEELADFIQGVDIVLGERPGLISRIVIHEGAAAHTVISFRYPELNPDIPDAVFREAAYDGR
ncbi:MAG: outer membrane lipoprotein carrier protein LolA [Desulfatibacillaceae bacterium]